MQNEERRKSRAGEPEYIHERVTRTDRGCWEWNLARTPAGYGLVRITGPAGRRMQGAHRLAYETFVGPVEGSIVCHRCDNPACCNPEHLFLGTHHDNMQDKVAKNRQPRGERHRNSKLTEAQVEAIRAASGTQAEVARQFGVSQPLVSAIRLRKVWRHVCKA